MCSNVILGVLVYLVTSMLQGCICEMCIVEMQMNCKTYNENLLDAEAAHNTKVLCLNLYDLLRCVARTKPDCLHVAMGTVHHHTETPHECTIGESLILELQALSNNATAGEIEDETTTQSEVSTLVSVSPVTVTIATKQTSPSIHNGSKEEQKGSKSHTMSCKVTDLVLFIAMGFILRAIVQRNAWS